MHRLHDKSQNPSSNSLTLFALFLEHPVGAVLGTKNISFHRLVSSVQTLDIHDERFVAVGVAVSTKEDCRLLVLLLLRSWHDNVPGASYFTVRQNEIGHVEYIDVTLHYKYQSDYDHTMQIMAFKLYKCLCTRFFFEYDRHSMQSIE